MASSKLDIISAALILIGDRPLTSLTEDTVAATVSANLYDSTYEAALASHRWRFATGKAQLARLTATPENEYTYAFQLPSNMLYLTRVFPESDYELFEDNLYSDQKEIKVDYLYKPAESELPAYFVKALEYELAKEFAISITNAMGYFERMSAEAILKWRQARFLDASQRPNASIQSNPFVSVRR